MSSRSTVGSVKLRCTKRQSLDSVTDVLSDLVFATEIFEIFTARSNENVGVCAVSVESFQTHLAEDTDKASMFHCIDFHGGLRTNTCGSKFCSD